MKHAKTVLALGIIVAIVPSLGFPTAWKNVIFPVLGLLIVFFAYRILLSRRETRQVSESHEESAFVHHDALSMHE